MSTERVRDEVASASGSAACPWCGGTDHRPRWRTPGKALPPFSGHYLGECQACGLVATYPRQTAEELAAWYPPAYYGSTSQRFYPLLELLVGLFRQARAREIHQLQGGGRVLDVGCGRGLTLAALRQLGWQVQGVEIGEAAGEHARQILQLDVACDGFHPERYEPESFDAVILWHVLEHLVEPRRTLEDITRLLRPGGVLALAVPNLASWQATLTGPDWFHLDVPRHCSHFRAAWLRERLAELGYGIHRERHLAWEQNVYGWLQSSLNRLGIAYGLLYDLLRRPAARRISNPWRRHPLAAAISLASVLPVTPLAALAALLEAAFRRGGTVEFLAVKKT